MPGQVQVAGVVMWEAMHVWRMDGGFEKERDPNVPKCLGSLWFRLRLCSDGTPIAKVEHEICDSPIAKTKVAR